MNIRVGILATVAATGLTTMAVAAADVPRPEGSAGAPMRISIE